MAAALGVAGESVLELDDIEEQLKEAQAQAAEAQQRVAELSAARDAALGKPTPWEEYMLDKDGYVSTLTAAALGTDVPPL